MKLTRIINFQLKKFDMRRKILLSACVVLFICNTIIAAGDDSTKIFETGNKRILVKENEYKQRMEVQVYELNSNQDSSFYEQIFEGHYRDGKSSEQRKYLATIDIPMPHTWKSKRFYAHWAGLGLGFAGFADMGDYDAISFRSSKSMEFNLNLFEKTIPISNRYKWAIVTGLGMRWTRYHLKGNYHFEEIDDYTKLVEAPEGIRYKASKLGITTINIPLLIEWQTPGGHLFFSAGVVGSVKTWSYSWIEFYDETSNRHKKKQKEKVDQGMTLRPVTMDILVQAGTRGIGVYARYSPISIFENNKGPELYPLTFGLMLHF